MFRLFLALVLPSGLLCVDVLFVLVCCFTIFGVLFIFVCLWFFFCFFLGCWFCEFDILKFYFDSFFFVFVCFGVVCWF